MCGELILMATIAKLPIKTFIRLNDDYPGTKHQIYSYTVTADGAYMEFYDGGKLDLRNMDKIVEVL